MSNSTSAAFDPLLKDVTAAVVAGPAATTGLEPTLETIRKVVAFTTEDISAAALRLGLQPLGDVVDVRRGDIRTAIRYFEREASATAAIIDISGIADPLAALEDLARVCPASVKVIIVGENTDIHFYRLLVNDLGVTEYLHKPLTRDMVQRLLLPALSGTSQHSSAQRGGHVVAVCGAGGGAGATTIAVSLAIQLSKLTKGHVALLDMNLQGSDAAIMMAARPGPGLRIALEEPGRADALFLDRTSIEVGERLRLIAADEAFNSPPSLTEKGVTQMIDLLRQRFNYIVVDLPVPPSEAMQRIMELARHVVVVMRPDVLSLRDANAIHTLSKTSAGSDRTLAILNRYDMKGGLDASLIRKGLGRDPDAKIPDLGPRMVHAVNHGKPAVLTVSALGRQIQPIIREVAGVRGSKSGSWLRRMIGR